MKNVSRNKFLLCFRPVVDMDLVLDHPNSRQPLLYVGVEKPNSLSDAPGTSSITRRPQRRTFSQAVRAAVFETILAKRVRENNAGVGSSDRGSNSRRSKRKYYKHLKSSVEQDKENKSGENQETVDSNSVPLSSSSSSSIQESLKQTPENGKINQEGEQKLKEEQRVRGSSLDSAFYLVMISLTLTVLCGRACAVVGTSVWLYFQRRRKVVRAEDGRKRLAETKSSRDQSCRKKVIMEGLLQRNNRRGSIQFST